jgi:hypothetical protein
MQEKLENVFSVNKLKVETLILASINPKYDKRLLGTIQVLRQQRGAWVRWSNADVC